MIVLYILLGLLILLLMVAAITKKEYATERTLTIGRPLPVVFDYLRHLRNQENYTTWAKRDPNVHMNYSGTDGIPGFIAAWESREKRVGKGEQQILEIMHGERIDMELRFFTPFEGTAMARITTKPAGRDATTVRWHVSSRMKYPMNIMLLFLDMDKLVGDDVQQGLENLKKLLENNA